MRFASTANNLGITEVTIAPFSHAKDSVMSRVDLYAEWGPAPVLNMMYHAILIASALMVCVPYYFAFVAGPRFRRCRCRDSREASSSTICEDSPHQSLRIPCASRITGRPAQERANAATDIGASTTIL
jgi:hypothetical protein